MQSQLPASIATALGQQFDREFAGSKPPARGSCGAYAAPIFLRDVEHGQAFIIDSEPQLLYVRARFGDQVLRQPTIPVVVIAAMDAAEHANVGRIADFEPLVTVRLVDIVRPIQARAR